MDGPLPKIGDIVAEKYRIESVAGEGGMGIVYRAHHLTLDQPIALKVLFGDAASRDTSVERFAREAQAAARISTKHVARVMDAGALADGRPFIAMELLEGENLETRLERENGGGIPVQDACDYMMQALTALGHAHAAGIVHRDIKPPNLFICKDADGQELVKVLDFGISKSHHSARRDKVLTGQSVLGSPAYMSPEQLRNASNIDARADLWSVGTVLYELLTGKLPFDAESVGEIFAAILEKDPVDPREVRGDLPEGLAEVLLMALRRDRDERFLTAIEFAQALAPFTSERFRETPVALERLFSASGITVPPSVRSLRAVTKAPASEPRPISDSGSSLSVPRLATHRPGPLSRGLYTAGAVALIIAGVSTVGLVRGPAAVIRERPPLGEEVTTATTAETVPLGIEIDDFEPTKPTPGKAQPWRGNAAKGRDKGGRPNFLKSSD